eukprot:6332519-Amphidinium_carterae.1
MSQDQNRPEKRQFCGTDVRRKWGGSCLDQNGPPAPTVSVTVVWAVYAYLHSSRVLLWAIRAPAYNNAPPHTSQNTNSVNSNVQPWA